MTVYYQPEMRAAFEDAMTAIAYQSPPTADQKCPHCGVVARYPIVARESDMRVFAELMAAAQAVLDRHGVMAHLLSEVHAEIAVSRARGQK